MSILDKNITQDATVVAQKLLKKLDLQCNSAVDDIVNDICRLCSLYPDAISERLQRGMTFKYNISMNDSLGRAVYYIINIEMPENFPTRKINSDHKLRHETKVSIRDTIKGYCYRASQENANFTISKIRVSRTSSSFI